MPRKKKVQYAPEFYCFDIETTHEHVVMLDGMEHDICYTWHWSIMSSEYEYNTATSWDEFWNLMFGIAQDWREKGFPRIIVYVHNLGYEFEAMIRNLFGHHVDTMFALDTHKPAYCVIDDLIEFRCSYLLTGKSLAACGKDVGLPKLEMNYTDIVKPGEKLSEDKEKYTYRDVEIMVHKIKQLEAMEEMPFTEFPLTNTGFLRNELRSEARRNRDWLKMFARTRLSAETYAVCKNAFMGGYVHANHLYMGKVMEDVDSFDFGSAYPFALACCKYPYGKLLKMENPDLQTALRLYKTGEYLFITTVTLKGVKAKGSNTFLSSAKCELSDDATLDNGRVFYAGMLRTTVTCLDLLIILQNYKIKQIRMDACYYCTAKYLPKFIIQKMMKRYEIKQTMKGVPGEELNYMHAKGRVNLYYGMFVQDPVNDIIEQELTEWKITRIDRSDEAKVQELLDKFYNSKNSFLPYQIGVFVPAYTRYFLWSMVTKFDTNNVYCDTDSAKVINREQCMPYINAYNEKVRGMIEKMRIRNEVEYPCEDLGIFDWETKKESKKWGAFKTLGAKKYLVRLKETGEFEMTVSGLSKKAVKYIESFDDFTPGTKFMEGVSGRTISHPQTNEIPTYDGGATWIEDTTYTLTIGKDYAAFTNYSQASQLVIYKDHREYRPWEDVQKDLKYDIDPKRMSPFMYNKLKSMEVL